MRQSEVNLLPGCDGCGGGGGGGRGGVRCTGDGDG